MTYESYQRELHPPPLRGDMGEAFHGVLGRAKDALVTLAKDAVYIGQTSDPDALGRETPDDGLERLGADADLEMGAIESPQDYRARILGAWDLWGWAGTPYGYSLAFARLKHPIYGARFIAHYEWPTIDWLTLSWSRFWPIIYTGALTVGRFIVGPWALVGGDASDFEVLVVGSGWTAGDGSTVGSTMTVEDIAEIRRALAKWKNARDRVPALLLAECDVVGTPGLIVGGFYVGGSSSMSRDPEVISITYELLVGEFVVGARGYEDDPDGPWFPFIERPAFV